MKRLLGTIALVLGLLLKKLKHSASTKPDQFKGFYQRDVLMEVRADQDPDSQRPELRLYRIDAFL